MMDPMALGRNRLRTRGLFASWLLSYLAILLISLLVSVAVYTRTLQTLEAEVNRTNAILTRQLKQQIDSKLAEIERMSVQIGWNPLLAQLVYTGLPLSADHVFSIIQLIKNLSVLSAINGSIDEMYVFLKKSRLVITTRSKYPAELAYSFIHEDALLSYEEWLSLMDASHHSEYVGLKRKKPNAQNRLALVQSLPIENPEDSYATLVVLVRDQAITDALIAMNWARNASVCIIDRSSDVLVQVGPFDGAGLLDYRKLAGSEGVVSTTLAGRKVVVSYIGSKNNQWKYAYVMPVEVYREKVSTARMLAGLMVLLCLALGGVGAYFLSRRNYNPIRRMISDIEGIAGIPFGDGRSANEYGFIRDTLLKTVNENKAISARLESQTSILKANFLAKLLRGSLGKAGRLDDMLSSFKIYFVSERFAVFLVSIGDYEGFFRRAKTSGSDFMERFNLVQFVITHVFEDLLGKEGTQLFGTEINEMMAFLVNFKQVDSEHLAESLRDGLRTGMAFLKSLHIHLTVSVSSIKIGVSRICEACDEAGRAMESRILSGEGTLLEYGQRASPAESYYYPIELELQLINHIRVGRFDDASRVIGEIFDRNFTTETISIEMGRHLLFDLESTLLKSTRGTEKPGGGGTSGVTRKRIEQLGQCSDLGRLRACILEIVKDLCGENAERHKKISQQCEQAIDFIKDRFMDVNLGLPMIAQHLGITADHLSRQFKRQIGESIVNTIHRYRINIAKQLLTSPDEKLADVARKVGYTSTNTLIRLFKKHEGVTPGDYRLTLRDAYLSGATIRDS